MIKSPPSGVAGFRLRLRRRRNDFSLSPQNHLHYIFDIQDKESIGLGKFYDLDPRLWLKNWLRWIVLSAWSSEN